MAGALLGSLPVAMLYSFFVEYYVSGHDRRRQGVTKDRSPAVDRRRKTAGRAFGGLAAATSDPM